MTWSCLIATHGDEAWSELAWKRAYPSAQSQGFDEVILEHHADATLAEARNRALASADCDWVVYLDADDELEPGFLEAMKRMCLVLAHGDYPDQDGRSIHEWLPLYNRQEDGILEETRPCRILLAPAVRYDREGRPLPAPKIPNRGRWPQLNECVIGTAAPRRLLLELGGFEEWPAWEDWALWLKCVARGSRIVYVEDAIYRAYVSATGRNHVIDGALLRESIERSHREWAEKEGVPSLL